MTPTTYGGSPMTLTDQQMELSQLFPAASLRHFFLVILLVSEMLNMNMQDSRHNVQMFHDNGRKVMQIKTMLPCKFVKSRDNDNIEHANMWARRKILGHNLGMVGWYPYGPKLQR